MKHGGEMNRPVLAGGTWLAAAVCAGVYAHVAWLHGSAGGMVGCAAVVIVSARGAGRCMGVAVRRAWRGWRAHRRVRARVLATRRRMLAELRRRRWVPLPLDGPWRLPRGGAGPVRVVNWQGLGISNISENRRGNRPEIIAGNHHATLPPGIHRDLLPPRRPT